MNQVYIQDTRTGQYKIVQIIGAKQIINVIPPVPSTFKVGDFLNDTQLAALQAGGYSVVTNPYA
jgi:hypothetical protein